MINTEFTEILNEIKNIDLLISKVRQSILLHPDKDSTRPIIKELNILLDSRIVYMKKRDGILSNKNSLNSKNLELV